MVLEMGMAAAGSGQRPEDRYEGAVELFEGKPSARFSEPPGIAGAEPREERLALALRDGRIEIAEDASVWVLRRR